jgi:oligopeptide/dipeptide ABC transporter ATP-binding protein
MGSCDAAARTRACESCFRPLVSPETPQGVTRTSSRAVSGSASGLPARSRSTPTSSSPTSRSRINLLEQLQTEFELTYLFIAHDLAVVRHISDRIAVMYLGTIVEISPAEELYENPLHPYTIALLSAVPIPDPQVEASRETILLPGDLPSPANPPPACRFHTRCPYIQPTRCTTDVPPLRKLSDGHVVACHWAEEIKAGRITPKEREAVFEPGQLERVAEPPPV